MMNKSNPILEAALALLDLGFCPLPAKDKFPFGDKGGSWKGYQKERPTREQIIKWFSSGEYNQIFMVCGEVSKGIVCIDLDRTEACLYRILMNALPPHLRDKLTCRELTQHGGFHILYLSQQHLSSSYPAKFFTGKLNSNEALNERPLAEVKSNGTGYICSPSAGDESGLAYRMESGSYETIPTLTPEEENLLIWHLQMLDKRPIQRMEAIKAAKAGTLPNDPYHQALLKNALKNQLTSAVAPTDELKPKTPTKKQSSPAPRLTFDKPLPPLADQMEFLFDNADDFAVNADKPVLKKVELTNQFSPEEKAAYSAMSFDEKKAFLRKQLPELLLAKGIDTSVSNSMRCPHPSHPDKKPSAYLHRDGEIILCSDEDPKEHEGAVATKDGEFRFDIFDVTKFTYGLSSFTEAFNKTEEIFGLSDPSNTLPTMNTDTSQTIIISQPTETPEPAQITSQLAYWHNCVELTDEWAKRGISQELIERYQLGYDPIEERLIIPTSPTCFNARCLKPESPNKYVKSPGAFTLFNQGLLFNRELPLPVVEGECDAIALEMAGIPALGLGGTGGKSRVLQLLSSKPLEELQKLPPLILMLDGDTEGQNAQATLARELREFKIPFINFTSAYEGCKDANELWLKEPETLKEMVQLIKAPERLKAHLAEKYRNEHCIIAYKERLFAGLTDPNLHPVLPTGISPIDACLRGGIQNGLTILGANSSYGKSTLAWQIASHAASDGRDVLYFSLEMTTESMIFKSITQRAHRMGLLRQEDGIPLSSTELYNWAKTPHSQEEDATLRQLIEDVMRDTGNHLSVIEADSALTVDDVRTRVEEHIEKAGRPPLVCVDYVQILASPCDKWDVKRVLDDACTKLKSLSCKYDLPVIAISSLNRQAYSEQMTLGSFKESGGLEYSADLLLGLQMAGIGMINLNSQEGKKLMRAIRNATNYRKGRGEVIPLEFVVLKNRSGLTDDTQFGFNPRAQWFGESPDATEWLRTIWSFVPTSVYAGSPGTSDFIYAILGRVPDQDFIAELNQLRFRDGSENTFTEDDGTRSASFPGSRKSSFGIVGDFAQFAE